MHDVCIVNSSVLALPLPGSMLHSVWCRYTLCTRQHQMLLPLLPGSMLDSFFVHALSSNSISCCCSLIPGNTLDSFCVQAVASIRQYVFNHVILCLQLVASTE